MTTSVELREVQVFLILAEQPHFGRTAERLGLTQSRVSQVLRSLERKLGGRLLHRTSRQVALTPLGRQLLAELGPAYEQLTTALERTRESNHRLNGVLRLGIHHIGVGPHLAEIVDLFETRDPGSELQLSELRLAEQLEPLLRGELDARVLRPPIDHSGIIVGPIQCWPTDPASRSRTWPTFRSRRSTGPGNSPG